MLRRFSINFALFSMTLDALTVGFALWLAAALRPLLNDLPGVETLVGTVSVPRALYLILPLLWLLIYSMLSIYDGRKFLRVVDEFSTLSFATSIASISAAGILYLSYRDVSRFLFLIFVVFVYLGSLTWRWLTRLYFRSQVVSPDALRD